MNITNRHTGKIGRLPKNLRDQLGLRLEDGQTGSEILPWLNAVPEVGQILADHFAGKPISDQNLSEWRCSGHLDWLRQEEIQQVTLDLFEQAEDLTASANSQKLINSFSQILAAQIMTVGMLRLREEVDLEKRWEILCGMRRELSLLRRDDYREEKLALQREQADRDAAREAAAKKAAERRQEEELQLLAAEMSEAEETPSEKPVEKAEKAQNSNQFKVIQTKTGSSATGLVETSLDLLEPRPPSWLVGVPGKFPSSSSSSS